MSDLKLNLSSSKTLKTDDGLLLPVSPTTENATADINFKEVGAMMSPSAERRTYLDRTFGKLGKGSIRGSIFALCGAAIGSGVLTLSYVLRLSGLVLGTMLIIIGAFASYWSLCLIAKYAIKTNTKNYSQLAHKAGGNCCQRFLQFTVLLSIFGACISFTIVAGRLIANVAL